MVDGPDVFGEAAAEELREPGGAGEEGGEEAGGMVWPEEEQDPFAAPVEGNSSEVQMEDEAEGSECEGKECLAVAVRLTLTSLASVPPALVALTHTLIFCSH